MDQNDIDALMNQLPGDDDDASSAGQSGASTPEDSSGSAGLNQDDLDALLREAEQLADGPSAPAPQPVAAEPALDSTGKPMDEAAAAMAAAIAEEQAAAAAAGGAAPAAELPLEDVPLPDFDVSEVAKQANQPLSLLYDVEMHVKIELGRTNMFVEDVLKLGEGSVVELDRLAGDPVDVFVNGRLVARGEVLVLNDNFCVRVSEIIADPKKRLVG